MRRIELTLPMPPKEFGRNAGEGWNWGKMKRLKDAHSVNVFAAAVNSKPDVPMKSFRVDIHAYTKRQMDFDNLVASLKSTFDQLARMGFFENDRDMRLGEITQTNGKNVKDRNYRVELTLTEL